MSATDQIVAGIRAGAARVRLSLGLLALGGVLAGCGRSEPSASSHGSAEIGTAGDDSDLLATIDGDSITMEDIRQRAGDDLDRMDIGYRRARSQLIGNTLDQVLRERVLLTEARRRGADIAASPTRKDQTEVSVGRPAGETQAKVVTEPLRALAPPPLPVRPSCPAARSRE